MIIGDPYFFRRVDKQQARSKMRHLQSIPSVQGVTWKLTMV